MPSPSKAQQLFLYVAPFPALAFFKIWASTAREPGSLFAVACILFGYCVMVIGIARRWDSPTYFDWAVTAYFAVAGIALGAWPETVGHVLPDYIVSGIYATLFLTALVPPLLGLEPFTYHYARKRAPKENWGNPIFISINRIITYVWAGLFALCVVISLYPSVVTRALIPISLMVGVGLPFSSRFPDLYLKRLGLPPLAKLREMARKEENGGLAVAPEASVPGTEAASTVPRPDSLDAFMRVLPMGFNPEAAWDVQAVLQFAFTGQVEGTCHFKIQDGRIEALEGRAERPDLIIQSPFEVWVDIITGKVEGEEMFMKRRYTAQGDMSLLIRMKTFFRRGQAA